HDGGSDAAGSARSIILPIVRLRMLPTVPGWPTAGVGLATSMGMRSPPRPLRAIQRDRFRFGPHNRSTAIIRHLCALALALTLTIPAGTASSADTNARSPLRRRGPVRALPRRRRLECLP